MKRTIGSLGLVFALAGAAAAVGRADVTSDAATTGDRLAFLPPPTGVTRAKPEQYRLDSARVRQFLQTARGVNTIMCDLAAMTIDGHWGWSSGTDGEFRAGGAADSLARDVVGLARHEGIDPNSVPVLRAALGDSDWCVRRLAAPLLGRSRGAPAMDAMLAALAASEASTREMGALALGFTDDDPRPIAPLIARLRDDAPRVRATAAWALGEIESRDAVRPLIAALADADALVRESAARALGEIEDSAAVPALTDLLKSDRDATVRRAVAWALGEILG